MTDKTFENALCLKWLTLEEGQYYAFIPPIKVVVGDQCPAIAISEESGRRILLHAMRDQAVAKQLSEPENAYIGWSFGSFVNQYGRLMTAEEQQEAREAYTDMELKLAEMRPKGRIIKARPHQNRYVGWHGA